MTPVAPPPRPAPTIHLGYDNPHRRVQFRMWQIFMTALTVLAAAWLFRFSVVAGIIALFFAKHVLVAVLAAGLSVPPPQPPQRDPLNP